MLFLSYCPLYVLAGWQEHLQNLKGGMQERSKESALKPGRIRKLEKSQGNLEKSCHHYEKWQNQGEKFQ